MRMRKEEFLARVVTWVLILAILPSFTALSESYSQAFPGIAGKTGPINPLKFFAPLLLVFVCLATWTKRIGSLRKGFIIIGTSWGIGTLFTLFAAQKCGFPSLFLREWASVTLGLLGGAALLVLPSSKQNRVFIGWFSILCVFLSLDLFAPSVIDWLYAHAFDPETRIWDMPETGTHALTGVFGRQSAAKLMAWIPWLVLPSLLSRFRRFSPIILVGCGVWAGLILATSQRGPMLSAFAALLVFGAHQAWIQRVSKPLLWSILAVVLGIASVFITVPSEITGPRLLGRAPINRSGEAMPDGEKILRTSEANAHFRLSMTRTSLDSIASHPMGNACIPKSFFDEHGIAEGHSHNLILEQFRSRGWIWGLIHLGLWLLAGFAFLRSRDLKSSGYLASITAILICGLVDHPWFVLNQSIVLGAVLVTGITLYFQKSAAGSNEV